MIVGVTPLKSVGIFDDWCQRSGGARWYSLALNPDELQFVFKNLELPGQIVALNKLRAFWICSLLLLFSVPRVVDYAGAVSTS